jgi:hypothetical protein
VSRPEGRQVFSNFGFSPLCAIGNLDMEKTGFLDTGFGSSAQVWDAFYILVLKNNFVFTNSALVMTEQ